MSHEADALRTRSVRMAMRSVFPRGKDALVELSKRLTPEERLVAYFRLSKLVAELYFASAHHRRDTRHSNPTRRVPK